MLGTGNEDLVEIYRAVDGAVWFVKVQPAGAIESIYSCKSMMNSSCLTSTKV